MPTYKASLIALCIESQILRFGEFKLKSGRISPYFFNAGLFNSGRLLNQLSRCYAQCIQENIKGDFMLFGPAYKGIPLAVATAIQLSQRYDRDIPYTFNRKEKKDHGEGGDLVGAQIKGNVVIVDDVITAGTAIYESAKIIQQYDAKIAGIVIALDRQEVADHESSSATQVLSETFKAPIHALLTLNDLTNYLEKSPAYNAHYSAVIAYREKFGCLS